MSPESQDIDDRAIIERTLKDITASALKTLEGNGWLVVIVGAIFVGSTGVWRNLRRIDIEQWHESIARKLQNSDQGSKLEYFTARVFTAPFHSRDQDYQGVLHNEMLLSDINDITISLFDIRLTFTWTFMAFEWRARDYLERYTRSWKGFDMDDFLTQLCPPSTYKCIPNSIRSTVPVCLVRSTSDFLEEHCNGDELDRIAGTIYHLNRHLGSSAALKQWMCSPDAIRAYFGISERFKLEKSPELLFQFMFALSELVLYQERPMIPVPPELVDLYKRGCSGRELSAIFLNCFAHMNEQLGLKYEMCLPPREQSLWADSKEVAAYVELRFKGYDDASAVDFVRNQRSGR